MNYSESITSAMTPAPFCVSPKDTLGAVQHLFETKGIHHAPVVQEGLLVGMVSTADFAKAMDQQQTAAKKQTDIMVQSIMKPDPVCLTPMHTLNDGLDIFRANEQHAIPIIDADRHVVGIVSTYDMIKLLDQAAAPESEDLTVNISVLSCAWLG
jgi:CBS domain-containing protein